MKQFLVISFLFFCCLPAFAQQNDKRTLTRQEVSFLASKVDSIRNNLNRMIRFEKQLMQRNYYLDEKTALVQELITTVQYLQKAVSVTTISDNEIRKIFGKPQGKVKDKMIYEIETYRSNCPFMEITFFSQAHILHKIDYRITDCQKWK